MNDIPALVVAVPLAVAGVLTATGRYMSRAVVDTVALLTAAAVTVMAVLVTIHVADTGTLIYWFGGWHPSHSIVLGIDFSVDAVGAGLAALSGFLVLAAFCFSIRFFEVAGALFHALILIFLAATTGFVMSGDIFNMFVFFELMSVTAYALTAYRVEHTGPLEGAVNFAVTNSIGGVLILIGVSLLYGRTGALNLAQIGEALGRGPLDGLIIVAFALIVGGFFVKAAMVPFHFWLADAYTVAPTPVLILFAGIMSELGLYAIARIYWSSFEPALGSGEDGLRLLFLVVGVLTGAIAAVLALQQHHLKRMLAFVTMAHAGLFLVGIALLEASALAGTALYVVADGLVKSSLFLCAGVLQHRFESVREDELKGRAKDLRWLGAIFLVGLLALVGTPPFGPFLGKAGIEDAATKMGWGWITFAIVAITAVTSSALVRAGGRIFLDLGDDIAREATAEEEEGHEEEEREVGAPPTRTPLTMSLPMVVLLVTGLALPLVPHLSEMAAGAAASFVDTRGYGEAVMRGSPLLAHAPAEAPTTGAYVAGFVSLLLTGMIAAIGLYARRAPGRLLTATEGVTKGPIKALRAAHSGHVGDYVAWLTLGCALLGAAMAGVFT